jgi:hypothetical protein
MIVSAARARAPTEKYQDLWWKARVDGLTEAEGGDGEPLSPVGKVKGILGTLSVMGSHPSASFENIPFGSGVGMGM